VSVGSTPTVLGGDPMPGVTEVRAGVYMFSDCFQAGLGSSNYEDIAISVLASVISNRPDLGHLVIDAGSLAMSKDRSTDRLGPHGDMEYGRVCHPISQEWIPTLRFTTVNQEHGIVKAASPEDLSSFPVGSLLRIQPNHACMTSACFDSYHVVEGNQVVRVWDRVNGW
jgi:D-serine deaminase-like pyridoxal phosphate-dependent protein